MIVALLLATLLLVGTPTRRSERSSAAYPVDDFEAIAAELRRGASLRYAVAAVYPDSRLSQVALSGQPMSFVAAELESRLGVDDPLIAAGLRLAAASGAPAASLFASLAERARSRREVGARTRILSAQARASAVVIAALPFLMGAIILASGSGGVLATSGTARAAVVAGVVLELLGAVLVVAMVKRARL